MAARCMSRLRRRRPLPGWTRSEQAGRGRGQRRRRRRSISAEAPADPAVVARGKAVYDINCALCHGEDARGGDNGPNLIRGAVVMNDQNGELIGPVLQDGRAAEGMPKFDFTAAQVSDISAFLHSFRVGGYDISRNRPPSIVVGDAKAGEAYFNAKCGSCHSATGDLKGIATRIADARTLQQRWLMPAGGGRGGGQAAPATVTVTLPLPADERWRAGWVASTISW